MLTSLIAGELDLRLQFLEAGSGGAKDGWVHEKIVPFAIAAQAIDGSYDVQSESGRFVTRGQEAFLSPANTRLRIVHHAGDGRETMRFRFVHVQFTLGGEIDLFRLYRLPGKTDDAAGSEIGSIIEELLALAERERALDDGIAGPVEDGSRGWLLLAAKRREIAYRLLTLLLERCMPDESYLRLVQGSESMLPLLSYIRSRLNEPIAVEELLAVQKVSRTALFQLFKKAFRQTPMGYVKTLRLQEGHRLLCSTGEPVGLIAEACGFATINHFSREFKRGYGVSPSEARAAYRRLFFD